MILPSPRSPGGTGRTGVSRYAEADIPTLYGPMRIVVFRAAEYGPEQDCDPEEHVALVIGDPSDRGSPDGVLVRVHSECLTSEVFGSLKCDCREQLEGAITKIREAGGGIVIYLRQEGRGIGLGNKIRAYALQARGMDTVEANHHVGFETDLRTYDVAAAMLENLGVQRVSLMTNNPHKVDGLEQAGIRVVKRIPLQIAPSAHSARYLATKRDRLGHLLDLIASVED